MKHRKCCYYQFFCLPCLSNINILPSLHEILLVGLITLYQVRVSIFFCFCSTRLLFGQDINADDHIKYSHFPFESFQTMVFLNLIKVQCSTV